ncbi:hypothetical protein IJU97_02135 [bacterium]|nr:hypothetical protein [bacterium]
MKEFKNWKEALNFSYVNYSESQYFSYIGKELPQLRRENALEKWKICQAVGFKRGIYMEITPLWVTLTIVSEEGQPARKQDFRRNGFSVKEVLQTIFE